MVISGGNFKPDTLKPKEVVSLLLDDEEIVTKCKFNKIIIMNLVPDGCLFVRSLKLLLLYYQLTIKTH